MFFSSTTHSRVDRIYPISRSSKPLDTRDALRPLPRCARTTVMSAGLVPAAIPKGQTGLVQGGLALPPVRLATQRGIAEDVMSILLANVRTPDERRGDVRAQLGASAAGRAAWRALVAREGTARVEQAGRALIEYSERSARAVVRQLADRVGHAEDALEGDGVSEDDVRVVVAIRQRD